MANKSHDSEAPLKADCNPRLVRRAKKLLCDIEAAGYLLSMVSGGGQPNAVLHPENTDLECDNCYTSRPGVHDLGNIGVGDMIAL